MIIGLVAGVLTGALWGLTFVAARAVEPYTVWDIAVARYVLFGLMSVLLMLSPRFRPRMPRRLIILGLTLGVTCYTGYFITAATSVTLAGAAIPPLVVGTMPVILAIIGNWRDRTVPWRSLAVPLVLIAIGVLVVNGEALATGSPLVRDHVLLGILTAVAALAIWVVFGAVNAIVMQGRDAPDSLHWTCIQGLGALVGSLLLLPMTHFTTLGAFTDLATTPNGQHFAAWAAVMGVVGSWFAGWTWMVASQRLPMAFTAQLVVFETVFALIYGFVVEARWPSGAEWAGTILQLVGVVGSVYLFTRPSASAAHRAVQRQRAVSSVA